MKANQQQKKNGILNFLLRLRLRETFEYVAVCKVMIPGLMRYVFLLLFGIYGVCVGGAYVEAQVSALLLSPALLPVFLSSSFLFFSRLYVFHLL